MEEVEDNEILKFTADIEKYKEFWSEIEIIVVAVRNENSWVNLITNAQFHMFLSDRSRTTGEMFKVRDLVVIRDLFFFRDFKRLLGDLKRGVLEIRGYQILYGNSGWGFKVRQGVAIQNDTEWNTLTLEGIGPKSIFELISSEKDVTSQLHYDGKYDSISDLIWNFMGYSGSMCYIEITAPIYIKIRGWVEEDKCVIECFVHNSVNPIDLELSWRIKKNGKVLDGGRKSLLRSEKVEETKLFCKLRTSIEVLNGDSMEYRLFYKEKEIDKGVIIIQKEEKEKINPRMVAHELFDKDFNYLKKWLKGEGKGDKQHKFECAFHMLFHIVGFTTEFLGYMGGLLNQGEIDVLAFTPDYRGLIATECTVKEGNVNEKRLKLYRRAKELEDELKIEIVPVIITCLEKDKIPQDLKDDIKSNEIALISCEEIKKIFKMTTDGKTAEDVFNYINELRKPEILFGVDFR